MLVVNLMKTYGMYLVKRAKEPGIEFNYYYLLTAILGVFVGFQLYLPKIWYGGSIVETFMMAGYYALGANLMFDLGLKAFKE